MENYYKQYRVMKQDAEKKRKGDNVFFFSYMDEDNIVQTPEYPVCFAPLFRYDGEDNRIKEIIFCPGDKSYNNKNRKPTKTTEEIKKWVVSSKQFGPYIRNKSDAFVNKYGYRVDCREGVNRVWPTLCALRVPYEHAYKFPNWLHEADVPTDFKFFMGVFFSLGEKNSPFQYTSGSFHGSFTSETSSLRKFMEGNWSTDTGESVIKRGIYLRQSNQSFEYSDKKDWSNDGQWGGTTPKSIKKIKRFYEKTFCPIKTVEEIYKRKEWWW